MINIKDYLHLYGIDCGIMTPDGLGSILVIYPRAVEVSLNVIKYQQVMVGRKGGGEMHYKYFYADNLKLVLRPLSDMTDEEITELMQFSLRSAESFRWHLKNHFDIFELIESGLAIDKTTLSQTIKYL